MNLEEPFKFSVAYSIHPHTQKYHNIGFFSTIFLELSGWKMKLYWVNENSI